MDKKLTLSEMAQQLKITPKTLNKYIELYEIPFIGIGRNKRFDAAGTGIAPAWAA
jgi:hypothetical protein